MLHLKMIIHVGCLLLAYSPTLYRDISVIMSVGPSWKLLYQVTDSRETWYECCATKSPASFCIFQFPTHMKSLRTCEVGEKLIPQNTDYCNFL
jgi:hypothetical protein